ncbi:hypothetical protein [Streptomyces cavernae]|uniref:hypothetical protein n=1 Tax=Streptomyces cavernae TaxID=2259034 RepID=UPI001391E6D7|nr:hypothetical protein [Streptomyces cavernae]
MNGVVGAGLFALILTACGAGGTDSAGTGGEAGAGSDEGTSKPAAATALPVESTARKATWTDRGATHQLEVSPKRLARGTAADLKHVRLDDDLKGMVPYYLTVSYTNTGSVPVGGAGPQASFTVTLADGTPGRAISLWNANPLATKASPSLPDNCDKAGPASVAPNDTATVCRLVMLPKGHDPATVVYSDEAGDTLLWKVGDGKGDDNGGSLLAAGTTADSSYEGLTNKGAVPIRVTPRSVRAGSLADLADYDLSDTQKNLVPWYVTFEYRNVGKEKLLPAMDDGVGLRTAGGRDIQPVPLLDFSFAGRGEAEGIDQCRGHVPNTRLEPNSALTLCTVHLLKKGDRPTMVSFEGEGKGVKTLTWRAL